MKKIKTTLILLIMVFSILSIIQIPKIPNVAASPGIEDFTNGWTEVDPASDITYNASRVTWDTADLRCSNISFYKDYGTDHFSGNFEHLFELYITSQGGAADAWRTYLWASSNTETAFNDETGCSLNVFLSRVSAGLSDFNLKIGATNATGDAYYGNATSTLDVGTLYYCTIERTDSQITLSVYTDSARENLNSTSILTEEDTTSYRFLYLLRSINLAPGTASSDSGYIQNLDLQEGDNSPNYSNVATNATRAGQPCKFQVKWTDDVSLDTCIFGSNNTGSWQNETLWSNSNETTKWGNVTKTLYATPYNCIDYQWWCSDTDGNWSTTGKRRLWLTWGYWEQLSNMTYGRQYATFGVIDGNIYVVGGRACPNDPDLGARYNYHEVYFPSNDSWVTKTPIPTVEDAGAGGVVDGNFYVIGGYPYGYKNYVYYPSNNSWSDTPTDISYRTWDTAGIVLTDPVGQDVIYVVGGSSDSNVQKTVRVYCPNNDTWLIKSDMNVGRAKHGFGKSEDGKIYVFSSNWAVYTKTNEVYNPATDTWSFIASKSYNLMCASDAVNGKIYLFKAQWVGKNYANNFKCYDIATNTFYNETNFDFGVSLCTPLQLVTINSSLYLIGGGGDNCGYESFKQKTCYRFVIPTISTEQGALTSPSIVGTSSNSYATKNSFQRKTFYANGRFWVFYSDGTNIVYKTSIDASIWSSATSVRACTQGRHFSIWFDGTYVHYAYSANLALYYRRGTPNADGTITWSATEQTVLTSGGSMYYPFIAVDSNRYAWIGYSHVSYPRYNACLIKSGNNDGTWGTTPSGFPYSLAQSDFIFGVTPIPLTNGKMLIIYVYPGNETIRARRWDGTTFGTEVTTTGRACEYLEHSAVAEGDNVHLIFCNEANYNILYTIYNYTSNAFEGETLIYDSNAVIAEVLSRDTNTGDLYCFWAQRPTSNHIYYRRRDNSTREWSPNIVDWIDESAEGITSSLTLSSFYQSYSGYIGLAYMTPPSGPYNVKFAALIAPPTIGTFTATDTTIEPNEIFSISTTIIDANSVDDLINATVEISSAIILKWDNATNSFTVYSDPNNYCWLRSGCERTTLSDTSYRLSWRISLYENYTKGSIDVVATNTKVYDSAGYSGSGNYTELFTFKNVPYEPPAGSPGGPTGLSLPSWPEEPEETPWGEAPVVTPSPEPTIPIPFELDIAIIIACILIVVIYSQIRKSPSTRENFRRKTEASSSSGERRRAKTK